MECRFIIDKWSVDCPWLWYLCLAILLSLLTRITLAFLRGIEFSSKPGSPGYLMCVWQSLRGYDKDPYKADYWFPFIIGIIELLVYPFLMKSGLWLGIGLWISLKTIPQWKDWQENRPVFNRFLIGNALVMVFSFIYMTNCINIVLKQP